MASGTGGQIAFIKVNTLFSTVNSVNRWTNFVSEGIEHKLEELEEGAITGRRDAPPSHKGTDFSEGDVNFEPNPNTLGDFLTMFFGTVTSSLVTAAGSTGANSGSEAGKPQVFHRWTPLQTPFGNQTFLPPYNFMVYRDVGSAFFVRGSIVPKLMLDFEAGQLVKSSISIMGRDSVRIERTAAITSLVSSGGRPWVWDMTSVEVSTTGTGSAALAATSKFERLAFTFELPHEGVVFLDGTKKYGEFQPNGFRRINIEGTVSFRDQTEYEAFTAYENRRLRLTALNVNSGMSLGNPGSLDATAFLGYYGFRLHIPEMKYLSWSAPIQGPNRLTAQFSAKAEYSETEGLMAAAEMLNVVPVGVYSTMY
jgi:hypothetical protein